MLCLKSLHANIKSPHVATAMKNNIQKNNTEENSVLNVYMVYVASHHTYSMYEGLQEYFFMEVLNYFHCNFDFTWKGKGTAGGG